MKSLRNWRTPYLWVALWPLLALLGIALLWADVARVSSNPRILAERTAINDVQAISHAYEQYLARSFAHRDQISMHLKQSVEVSEGQLDLARLAGEGMFHDSAFACVAVSDASGRVRSAVREPSCEAILQVAEIGSYHAGNNSSAMRISVPPGRAGTHQFIILSRRVETRDNDFAGAGAVMLVLKSGYVTDFHIPLTAARGGSVTALGTASEWHASSGGLGANGMASAAAQYMQVRNADNGARIADSGKQARIVLGWTRSPAYPVIGMVALPDHAISAPVHAAAAQARSAAWLGTLALALLGLLAAVLSRRAADRYSTQQTVRKAYRAATEGANDGFYMVAPVRGRHGVIEDFEIVDCNERGASFYGVARQAIIGQRLSSVEPTTDSLFASYLAAMEHGFHEDECQLPQAGSGSSGDQAAVAWGHRRLVRVGSGLAVTLRDISERKSHLAELDRLSNQDALTGLPNRQWLLTFLPAALTQAPGEVAVLFIDICDVKQVNDTHGHQLGDQLLQASAQRLTSLLRPEDVVVRFGGDEFVVPLMAVEGDTHSARVAERITNAFAAPFPLANLGVLTGACVGISVYPRDASDSNDLIRHAAIAMEAGKAEGKGQFRFYEASLSRSLHGSMRMKQNLLDAIEGDQFVLYYQPRVDAVASPAGPAAAAV